MNYYSNLRPRLVDPKLEKTVYKLARGGAVGVQTISDKITKIISDFYEGYIREHIFLTIILLIMASFLIYRYNNKNYYTTRKNIKPESFSNEESNILKDITSTQTAHLRYDTQPRMNPLYPVDTQHEHVNYPPEPLPINIPGNGIMYTRNLYNEPKQNTPLNVARDYDYGNVYDYDSRSYYTGGYNTYQGAQDTNIENSLGYPTNFNTTTGKFISGATRRNEQNLVDYESIIDNTQGNLVDSLRFGGNSVVVDGNGLEFDLPYASDF
jgi:hypothetical protein